MPLRGLLAKENGRMKMTLPQWKRSLELLVVAALLVMGGAALFHPAPEETLFSGSVSEKWATKGIPADLNEFLKLSVTDLNTADREALMALPKIGEVLSARILEYRGRYGPFASWEDLMQVRGIGERTVDALRLESYLSS